MLWQENVSGLWLNCCTHDEEKKTAIKKKQTTTLIFHTADPETLIPLKGIRVSGNKLLVLASHWDQIKYLFTKENFDFLKN